jgi:hypothetical protein
MAHYQSSILEKKIEEALLWRPKRFRPFDFRKLRSGESKRTQGDTKDVGKQGGRIDND